MRCAARGVEPWRQNCTCSTRWGGDGGGNARQLTSNPRPPRFFQPTPPPPLALPTCETAVVAWQAAPDVVPSLPSLSLPPLPKLTWWQRWTAARARSARRKDAASTRPPPLPDLPRAASLSRPKSTEFPAGAATAGATAAVVVARRSASPRTLKAGAPVEAAVEAGEWAPMTVTVLD